MIHRWLRIIRAYSLTASACPVLVGGMVYLASVGRGLLDYSLGALGELAIIWAATLLCAMALQVFSNLVNDYYDFRKGADQKDRAGFSRPLAEGTVSINTILMAAVGAASLAIVLGAYLVWVGRLPILIIGVLALVFAWLYTATRFSLAYLGLGDVFVFLFYGLIAAWGTGYLLGAPSSPIDYALSLQLLEAGAVNGLISMLVLSANNLRDIEDDRPVGKRTFPVRFGKRMGEMLVLFEILFMPVCAYLAFGWSLPMLIVFPGLLWVRGVWRAEGAGYNRYLAFAGIINIMYVLLVFAHLFLFN